MSDHLPDEIVTNLLSMLPVKSVVRFRSVCKTWCSIIDSPQFSSMHFANSAAEMDNPSSSFIFFPDLFKGDFYVVEDDDDTQVKSSTLHLPFYDPSSTVNFCLKLVGSSNGLICLSNCNSLWRPDAFVYICNPTTRQYIRLPDITRLNPCNPSNCLWKSVTWGFSFDPSSNEFKVALIISCEKHNVSEVLVYTQGANSWRKGIHDLNAYVNMGGAGVFLNGSVHWIEGCGCDTILSFDMASETFAYIWVPIFHLPSMFYVDESEFELGVLGGCLCISMYYSRVDPYEFWVLKDYKVHESWTKQFVIRKDMIDGTIMRRIVPVSFRMNGDLLLLCDYKFFVAYNHETGTATTLEGLELSKLSINKVFPHVWHLISPK